MSQILKYDAKGNLLPPDAIDHSILVMNGLRIDVRKRTQKTHMKAMAECTKVDLLGAEWRAPTVREVFALANHENPEGPFPKELFPHIPQYAWIWTSTPYAREKNPARPVYAWCVGSGSGNAGFLSRKLDGLALPVSPLAARDKGSVGRGCA